MKQVTPDDRKDAERITRALDRLVQRNGAVGIGFAIGACASLISLRSNIPLERALDIIEKTARAAKEAKPHAP